MTSPTRTSPPVRLTRRGRIVIVLMLMLCLLAAAFTLGRGSSQAAPRQHLVRHTVTVEAGETLWSVAARIAPHADPRLVVADISALNHLTSAVVEPGQQLIVPTVG